MKQEDDDMLDAFRSSQAWAADRIRQMGGDPAKPTPKQAKAVARELIDRAMLMKALVDPGSPPPTAEGIMRDYRKLQRMKKRRDH